MRFNYRQHLMHAQFSPARKTLFDYCIHRIGYLNASEMRNYDLSGGSASRQQGRNPDSPSEKRRQDFVRRIFGRIGRELGWLE